MRQFKKKKNCKKQNTWHREGLKEPLAICSFYWGLKYAVFFFFLN
ncbi:hypothetical protein Pint_33888 [Pistacia integerrima]|uniref:Uncharacterized protein n=1 Tax=Pistacia integerrima TaxID=434235 RepID=A0ACC0X6L6_9ROSI|nr:hypothetical protein Pint_33888 [Pistacia integerrima]